MEPEIIAPAHHRTREGLAFRARTALCLGRFRDAIETIEILVEHYGQQLTGEERNLICTVFTSAVREKTSSLRMLADIEREGDYSRNSAEIKYFRDIMELETGHVCNKGAEVLEHYLIPSSEVAHERLTLLKMIGDLYWHQISFAKGCNKPQVSEKILHSYEEALSVSQSLVPAHPIRLSIELNLSAFHYEVLCDLKRAWLLANRTIANGTQSLRCLDENSRIISRTILQLLQENMMMWVANQAVEDEEEEVSEEEKCQAESEELPEAKEPVTAVLPPKSPASSPRSLLLLTEPKSKKCQPEAEVAEPKMDFERPPSPVTGHAEGSDDPEPVAEPQLEPDATADPVLEVADPQAVDEPEPPVWQTPYSTRSPSPVQIRDVPRGLRLSFEDPPHDCPVGATKKQIRRLRKSSPAKRGAMG